MSYILGTTDLFQKNTEMKTFILTVSVQKDSAHQQQRTYQLHGQTFLCTKSENFILGRSYFNVTD